MDIFSQYIERSLGMSWNIESDNFIFKHVKKEATVMKRVILSSVLLIFDPLGNVTPAILDAKLIIQDLWKKNVDWDDCIPEKLKRMKFFIIKVEPTTFTGKIVNGTQFRVIGNSSSHKIERKNN